MEMQLSPQARRLRSGQSGTTWEPKGGMSVELILWLIAVVLVISGIVALVRGAVMYGIVLIVVGLLVGPGGVSIFT